MNYQNTFLISGSLIKELKKKYLLINIYLKIIYISYILIMYIILIIILKQILILSLKSELNTLNIYSQVHILKVP